MCVIISNVSYSFVKFRHFIYLDDSAKFQVARQDKLRSNSYYVKKNKVFTKRGRVNFLLFAQINSQKCYYFINSQIQTYYYL